LNKTADVAILTMDLRAENKRVLSTIE